MTLNRSDRKAIADAANAAALFLIGMVRVAELDEGAQADSTRMTLDIKVPGGSTETWRITIERTKTSAH